MKNKIIILSLVVCSLTSSAQWATKWETLNTGTSKNINAMYFHNPDTGYIVGEDYLFKKTTNGGQTWVNLIAPTAGEQPGNKGNIIGIEYYSTAPHSTLDSGLYLTWEKGYHGVITRNDGVTYTNFGYLDSNFFCNISGFELLPENKGNGYVNMITFGQNCNDKPAYYTYYDGPFSFAFSDSLMTQNDAKFTSVDRDSNTTIFGTSNGYIWRHPWVTSKPDSVYIDSNSGVTAITNAGQGTWYVGGLNSMYISSDSGKSFSHDPMFTQNFYYPEVHDMSFVEPNKGIVVATSNTINGVVAVRDSSDWYFHTAQYPLKAAKLFKNEVGYVAGENGLMLKTGGKIDSTNSVIEIIEKRITLYPNPASNSFKLRGLELNECVSIQIQDVKGQVIREFKSFKNEFDIAGLPKGLYWVSLSTSQNHFVNQLIIGD